MDLFEHAERYPQTPGYRRTDTSKAAAASMKDDAGTLRGQVLTVLTRFDGTADECAAILHVDKLAIRPRLTELKEAGLIEDTGARRRNDSGRKAIVWRRVAKH